MTFFNKNIGDLGQADLEGLISQQFAEQKTIEYKEQLNVGSDSEKKFLSQVYSLAKE